MKKEHGWRRKVEQGYRRLVGLTVLAVVLRLTSPDQVQAGEVGPLVENGREAHIGEFSQAVEIVQSDNAHWCGGVVVKEDMILTAAHCVVEPLIGEPINKHEVIFGSVIQGDKQAVRRHIVDCIVPDTYVPVEGHITQDDMAVCSLSAPVTFGKDIQPAVFGDKHYKPQTVTVAGLGFLDKYYTSASVLQTGQLPFNGTDCPPVGYCYSLVPGNLVFGSGESGSDLTRPVVVHGGDSGSLILDEQGRLVSLVSGSSSYESYVQGPDLLNDERQKWLREMGIGGWRVYMAVAYR